MRRSGGRDGCSEGCWQHRLLSRCYIEWVDEYLRRSTSCGFFFNQANLCWSSFLPSCSAFSSSLPVSTCSDYDAKRVKLFMRREREKYSRSLCATLRDISPVIFTNILLKFSGIYFIYFFFLTFFIDWKSTLIALLRKKLSRNEETVPYIHALFLILFRLESPLVSCSR